MKKCIKTLTLLLITAAVWWSAAVTAKATGATTTDPVEIWREAYYQMYDQYLQQQQQISSLQQQLQNQSNQSSPTARPAVYAPKIKLLSPQTVTMERDEATEVEVSLKNIGTSVASNVLVQALPSGDSPLAVEFLDGTNSFSTLSENGTRTLKLRITADSDAKAGTYAIDLSYAYKNRNSDNLSESDKLYVKVGGKAQTPNVMLRDFRADKQTLKPGDSFTLTATMENTGDGAAREVLTALDGLDAERLYLTSDLNVAYFSEMNAQHAEQVRFSFTVASRAKSGAYPINFKLTYRDEAGESKESAYTYYVNVTPADTENKPLLEIRDLSTPGGQTDVDQNAVISFQLFNNSALPANHIKITATPSDETALVPKSTNIQLINSLPAEEGKQISFTFSPTAAAKSRSYVVGLHVEYETGYEQEDGKAEVISFDQYASVNVNNPEEETTETVKGNKPKMIVSEYSVDPQIVRAGREFDLHLTFQNASAIKSVNNIKITLTAVETTEKKGSVFTPVGGSNTFYIDEIDTKGTESRILRMYTVPDADPRTYNIAVNFSYQDEDYNDYEEFEQISINVKQVTRIETSDIYVPESLPLGQQVYLNFNVINSGRVSLSNLRVRVEGNFDTTNADLYVGNLGKGNSIYYEGFFIPQEVGSQKGEIIVYGEDDTGEIIEFTKPFTLNVMEMSMDESMMGGPMDGQAMDMPAMDEPTTVWGKILNFIKKPYFWGPAAGLVALITIIVIVRVRRKNKRIDFDE